MSGAGCGPSDFIMALPECVSPAGLQPVALDNSPPSECESSSTWPRFWTLQIDAPADACRRGPCLPAVNCNQTPRRMRSGRRAGSTVMCQLAGAPPLGSLGWCAGGAETQRARVGLPQLDSGWHNNQRGQTLHAYGAHRGLRPAPPPLMALRPGPTSCQ